MSTQIEVAYRCRQWLSLEQVKRLLEVGELEITSPQGTVCLYLDFIDRVTACELIDKSKEK